LGELHYFAGDFHKFVQFISKAKIKMSAFGAGQAVSKESIVQKWGCPILK
jgi:hypothetical protein